MKSRQTHGSGQTSQYASAVGRGLNADPSHTAIGLTITWQRDMG